MSLAINTATSGLLRAGQRFEDAAGRVARGGAERSNQLQETIRSSEARPATAPAPQPEQGPRQVGIENIGTQFSCDLATALIDLQVAEIDFEANAKVVATAYELTDALLESTDPRF